MSNDMIIIDPAGSETAEMWENNTDVLPYLHPLLGNMRSSGFFKSRAGDLRCRQAACCWEKDRLDRGILAARPCPAAWGFYSYWMASSFTNSTFFECPENSVTGNRPTTLTHRSRPVALRMLSQQRTA